LSDEETRIRNALKTRLDNLLSQLDEMAEKERAKRGENVEEFRRRTSA